MSVKRRVLLAIVLVIVAATAAALTTRDTRSAASHVGQHNLLLPTADSTVDAADRAMVAGEYNGISAGLPPVYEGRPGLRIGPWITISYNKGKEDEKHRSP